MARIFIHKLCIEILQSLVHWTGFAFTDCSAIDFDNRYDAAQSASYKSLLSTVDLAQAEVLFE